MQQRVGNLGQIEVAARRLADDAELLEVHARPPEAEIEPAGGALGARDRAFACCVVRRAHRAAE